MLKIKRDDIRIVLQSIELVRERETILKNGVENIEEPNKEIQDSISWEEKFEVARRYKGDGTFRSDGKDKERKKYGMAIERKKIKYTKDNFRAK